MNAFFGEVIGTAILILLGNGVVANVVLTGTKGHGSGWIVITWGWGMAVFVAVFTVAAFSGAHLNPAIGFEWSDVPSWVAALPAAERLTEDDDLKLACFCKNLR